MGPPDLLPAIARVVPAPRLLTAPAGLAAFESDGLTTFRARPRAVVLPETADEVIAVVRLCAEAGVPFVARGSGTSLSGGAVPHVDGIVISLNRMTRIIEIDPVDRIAVVEPGVINLDVSAAAIPLGLYYAPDPSSQAICTIGGNVAFNSGGAHCFRHGMTLNHVLGLKAVLADGTVVTLGGRSLDPVGPDLVGGFVGSEGRFGIALEITLATLGGRSLDPVGPDLVGGFVGSEGRFGIALEITLRLLPRPAGFRTVLAAYRSLEAAGDAVSRIVRSGLLPGAMEIMDHLAIQAAEAAVHAGYPLDAAAVLLVELEGEAADIDAQFVDLEALIRASGAYQIRIAQNAAERLAMWKGRKSAFSAVGRLSPDFIVQDGVVPRSRLGEALVGIEAIGKRHGIRVANVFHAGDGNLHPLILFDGRVAGAHDRAEACAAEILRLCIALGGSITGEHGVGLEKRDFLAEQYGEADIACMKELQRTMDPRDIANPGKVFAPVTPADAARHFAATAAAAAATERVPS